MVVFKRKKRAVKVAAAKVAKKKKSSKAKAKSVYDIAGLEDKLDRIVDRLAGIEDSLNGYIKKQSVEQVAASTAAAAGEFDEDGD